MPFISVIASMACIYAYATVRMVPEAFRFRAVLVCACVRDDILKVC